VPRADAADDCDLAAAVLLHCNALSLSHQQAAVALVLELACTLQVWQDNMFQAKCRSKCKLCMHLECTSSHVKCRTATQWYANPLWGSKLHLDVLFISTGFVLLLQALHTAPVQLQLHYERCGYCQHALLLLLLLLCHASPVSRACTATAVPYTCSSRTMDTL
jgi:hypothetical protein